jgi:hypothetical protein
MVDRVVDGARLGVERRKEVLGVGEGRLRLTGVATRFDLRGACHPSSTGTARRASSLLRRDFPPTAPLAPQNNPTNFGDGTLVRLCEFSNIAQCTQSLLEFVDGYERLVYRSEQEEHLQIHLQGLVGGLERKSIEPIATAKGSIAGRCSTSLALGSGPMRSFALKCGSTSSRR